MSPTLIGAPTGGTQRLAGDPPPVDPARLKEVAAQFEALLVAQMLKHIRESGSGGWMGGGEDSAGATMVAHAEEHLAQALAAQGGLGLASLIEQSITPGANNSTRQEPSDADKTL